jgi:hypothetical protein
MDLERILDRIRSAYRGLLFIQAVADMALCGTGVVSSGVIPIPPVLQRSPPGRGHDIIVPPVDKDSLPEPCSFQGSHGAHGDITGLMKDF